MMQAILNILKIIGVFFTTTIEYMFFPIFVILNLLSRVATVGLLTGLLVSIAPFFNESLAQTTQHSDNLQEIIVKTFGDSLEMTISKETEISAREGKKQAFYKLFPQLSLTASQRTYDRSSTTGSTTTSNNGQESTSQTIKLSQTLLGSGAPSYSYVAAKSDHNIAIQQLRMEENNILLQIINNYSNLYTAQRIKEIAETNLNRLQQHYNATKERQTFGSASITELKQAEAQLENARANNIQTQGAMLSQQASFEALTNISVTGKLIEPVIINQDLLPKSLDDATAQAESFSPAVKIALQQKKKSTALQKRSGLPLLPNLSVEIGQTETESPAMSGTGQSTSDESFMSLNFSYNITPGQAISARKQAVSLNRSRQAGVLLSRRNLRSATIVAWQNYITAKAVLTASKLASSASKSAFDGTKAEYDLNRRSQLELLDAQETWLNSEQSYYQAFGSYVNAHYQLLANSGQLTYMAFKS